MRAEELLHIASPGELESLIGFVSINMDSTPLHMLRVGASSLGAAQRSGLLCRPPPAPPPPAGLVTGHS